MAIQSSMHSENARTDHQLLGSSRSGVVVENEQSLGILLRFVVQERLPPGVLPRCQLPVGNPTCFAADPAPPR